MTGYLFSSASFIAIFAIAALGLNLQYGFAGLFNVGIVGFFAVGSYATAIITGPRWAGTIGGFGLPVVLGLSGAALAAGCAAWAVGAVLLRLGGDYLAIATFGAGMVVQVAAVNLDWLTNGPSGLAGIPTPFRGIGAAASGQAAWFGLCVLVLLAVWALLALLAASPWSRALLALSEDAVAAAAMGKDVRRFRLQAFTLGSALCGLAGGLYAHFIGFVSPQDFLPVLTFQIYAMVIVGGTGRHAGAVLGAALVWLLWSGTGFLLADLMPAGLQSQAASLRVMLIAAVLLGCLLLRPEGLIGRRDQGVR